MKLAPTHFNQLLEALLDGFNYSQLNIMLRTELGKRLEEIVSHSSFDSQVRELIEWAERKDILETLILAAQRFNTLNKKILQLDSIISVLKRDEYNTIQRDSNSTPSSNFSNKANVERQIEFPLCEAIIQDPIQGAKELSRHLSTRPEWEAKKIEVELKRAELQTIQRNIDLFGPNTTDSSSKNRIIYFLLNVCYELAQI